LIRITVWNRGPDDATIHVLPHLWFRNTWSWTGGGPRPVLKALTEQGCSVIQTHHTDPLFQESLSDSYLYVEENVPLLFTENETNHARLFGGENTSPFVKDGINDCVVLGKDDAVNPARVGTKAAAQHQLEIAAKKAVPSGFDSRESLPVNSPCRSVTSTKPWRRGSRKPTSFTTP
jgi:hypothetical protein